MRLGRLLIGVVAVLVGGGIGAYLGLRSLDLDDYKDVIAAEVKDITGRDLTIDGHITFTLSLKPTVTLRDLALANAHWAGEAPLLEVGEAVITFDLLQLIFGTWDTTEVYFGKGTLRLTSDADGMGNWELGIDEEGVERTEDYLEGPFPYVHGIYLRNFDYEYKGQGSGFKIGGHLDEFLARYNSQDHSLKVGLEGTVKQQKILAEGTAGKITTLYAGGRSDVDFDIALSQTKLTLKGQADSAGEAPAFQGDFSASGPGLLDLATLAAVTLPDLGALVANGKLTVTDEAVSLTDLSARLGLSDLAGQLSFGLGAARPVTADLTSTRLDLTPWLSDIEAAEPTAVRDADAEDFVFSDAPLGLGALPPLTLDVTLQADSFTAGDLTLKSMLLHIKQKDKDLQVDPFRVDYKDATFTGELDLQALKTPKVALKVLTQNFDLGNFLKEYDITDLVEGEIDVGIDVAGQGDSLHALVGSADGKIGLVMAKGKIDSRYVDLIAVDLLQQMMPWKKSIDEADVKCALGQFSVDSGKAKIQTLLFDTKNISMTGSGYVDLSDEKLDLWLYPRPKDPSFLSLATGLRVTGTLSDTHVSVNPWSLVKDAAEAAVGVALLGPAGVLVPFASLGAGHHHPCVNDLMKVFGTKVGEDMKEGDDIKALTDEGKVEATGDAGADANADSGAEAGGKTGEPLPTEVLISLSASQITQSVMQRHLEDLGFTDITSVEKDGTQFHVKASWQGQPVSLHIDGRLGSITETSP